jgi:hypothetical protein
MNPAAIYVRHLKSRASQEEACNQKISIVRQLSSISVSPSLGHSLSCIILELVGESLDVRVIRKSK